MKRKTQSPSPSPPNSKRSRRESFLAARNAQLLEGSQSSSPSPRPPLEPARLQTLYRWESSGPIRSSILDSSPEEPLQRSRKSLRIAMEMPILEQKASTRSPSPLTVTTTNTVATTTPQRSAIVTDFGPTSKSAKSALSKTKTSKQKQPMKSVSFAPLAVLASAAGSMQPVASATATTSQSASQPTSTRTSPTTVQTSATTAPAVEAPTSQPSFDPEQLKPPPKGKQLKSMKWFLTFPRMNSLRKPPTKDQMMTRIKDKFRDNLLGCLIAMENHKDGTPHAHVLIRLNKPICTRDRNYFDFVCGYVLLTTSLVVAETLTCLSSPDRKHGNYLVAKSPYAIFNYLHKSDTTPLAHGAILDPSKPLAQQQVEAKKKRISDGGNLTQSKAAKVASDILSGCSLRSLVIQDPAYYMLNKTRIESFYFMSALQRKKDLKLPWPGPLKYMGTDHSTSQIIEWLNSNIKSIRHFRQRQLYVSGPKQYYKTVMVELLKNFLMIYDVPDGEDFYDMYQNDFFDLILMDEFRGQKKIQDLNKWLQGSDLTLRKKGTQFLKEDNPAFIFLSNYSLREVYAKALSRDPNKLDTLESRLLEIQLWRPLDIRGFAEALGLQDSSLMKNLVIVEEDPNPYDAQIMSAPRTIVCVSSTSSARTIDSTNPPTSAISHESSVGRALESLNRHRRFCSSCGEKEMLCECS